MRPRNNAIRGYSLVEILVVVAIIGIMSMVAVPAFVNYSRTNSLKSAMTSFTTDLRNCRQRAISRNSQVLFELDSSTTYSFWESSDGGTTFTPLQAGGANGWSPQPSIVTKSLDKVVYVSADTLASDVNSKHGVIFMPNGTAILPGNAAGTATVTLSTAWTNVYQNQFLVTIYPTGKIKSDGSHT